MQTSMRCAVRRKPCWHIDLRGRDIVFASPRLIVSLEGGRSVETHHVSDARHGRIGMTRACSSDRESRTVTTSECNVRTTTST
jgi:hypothetical protein